MRAILGLMVKRLFPLLVALVVAGAPVALEACQIVCASTSVMAAADAHHGHDHGTKADGSCHEVPPATHHLTPQSPACDHDGKATVPSVVVARNSETAPQLAAVVPPLDDLVVVRRATFVHIRQALRPDRLESRLARPLRV